MTTQEVLDKLKAASAAGSFLQVRNVISELELAEVAPATQEKVPPANDKASGKSADKADDKK